ncbi:MAG: hypothetical protein RL346_1129 [Verrucomicrobiota bacterium]|jgi:hypothetical protein
MVTAFKEWRVVCDALASGRQTVILRKGGIHEGKEGFSFAHDSFFLFPTHFHAQMEQVREGDFMPEREWEPGDLIGIRSYAEVTAAVTLRSWEQIARLLPYHIYKEDTIRDRFEWDGKGMASGSIQLAIVRVYELARPWRLTYEKRYGGCRSWVDLPEPPEGWLEEAIPVIKNDPFVALAEQISEISGISGSKIA